MWAAVGDYRSDPLSMVMLGVWVVLLAVLAGWAYRRDEGRRLHLTICPIRPVTGASVPRCRQGVPAGPPPARGVDREHRQPGTPCWTDLATPGLDEARRFYPELFGWTGRISPEPEAGGYTVFLMDGRAVAGAGPPAAPDQVPIWSTYLATDDADLVAARVEGAGGQVRGAPVRRLRPGPDGGLRRPGRGGVQRLAADGDARRGALRRPGGADLERAGHPRSGGREGLLRAGLRLAPGGTAGRARPVHRLAAAAPGSSPGMLPPLATSCRRTCPRTGRCTSRWPTPTRPPPAPPNSAARPGPAARRSPAGRSPPCATPRAPSSRSSTRP